MNWKAVLYSGHNIWKDLDAFFEFALKSGYKFFEWNGRIYFISAGHYMDIGLKSADLDK